MHSRTTRLTSRPLGLGLMVAIVLLALSQSAFATATASFTLKEVDKGGATQTLGTWAYDSAKQTFVSEGTEASFVQTLTPYLRYSGKDSAFTKLGVVKKGIRLSDLVTYAVGKTSVPLGEATKMESHATDGFTSSTALAGVSGRYYYPSSIISGTWDDATRSPVPAVFAITSYNVRNNDSTDRGWGIPALVALNSGAVHPVPTDTASLDGGFSLLASAADDASSLKLFLGQIPGTPDANLGSLSATNVDTVTFTPAYETIAVSVKGGDSATVATDDGYLKAAAGEPVSFTIGDVMSGYQVDSIVVADVAGKAVTLTSSAGTYSFTMPASAVTITVTLAPSDVVLQVMYDGGPRKSYTLAQLRALPVWAGYAGLWRGSYANGPDAVTGVTVQAVVQDALGTPLTASENVQVTAADAFSRTFSYDRLTNFTGFLMYNATSGQIMPIAGLTGPLAAVLVYDDPAGDVMPAATGPLRFFIGDAAAANADDVVMAPANDSVQRVASLDVQPIPATGVSVAPTSLTLRVGDAGHLVAMVVPADAAEKDVAWSSTNASIATVDEDGLVKAKAAGTIIIKATTVDGGFTADCAVTVTAAAAGMRITAPRTTTVWARDSVQKVRWVLTQSLTAGAFTVTLRDAAGHVRLKKAVEAKRGATAYMTRLGIGAKIRRGTYTVKVRWSNGSDSLNATSPKFRVK